MSAYLNNKCWAAVTREERFFCAHLWQLIRIDCSRKLGEHLEQLPEFHKNGPHPWFNSDLARKIAAGGVREVGFEVCFYRDLPFQYDPGTERDRLTGNVTTAINRIESRSSQTPDELRKGFLKRTFDLCLFLDREIVIIEAKAQQGFHSAQLATFQDDKELIKKILEPQIEHVHLVALTSSGYKNPQDSTRQVFGDGGWITWQFLADCYAPDPILAHADLTYGAGSHTQDEDAK